jgi:hypothetical protein
MTMRYESLLLAVVLTWTSATAAMAQNNCDRLSLAVDDDIYGVPTTTIEPALPQLQRRFDEALQEVCKVSSDPWQWRASLTELHLLNAPEANQMSIYLSEDEQSAVVEYPFEMTDGVLSDLPATEEFRRAIICASDSTEQFQLDPSDCLPD